MTAARGGGIAARESYMPSFRDQRRAPQANPGGGAPPGGGPAPARVTSQIRARGEPVRRRSGLPLYGRALLHTTTFPCLSVAPPWSHPARDKAYYV